MIIYAIWYGGVNYTDIEDLEQAEKFASIEEAKKEFSARLNGYSPSLEVRTPCVTSNSKMFLYKEKPEQYGDVFGWFEVGIKGGINYIKGRQLENL